MSSVETHKIWLNNIVFFFAFFSFQALQKEKQHAFLCKRVSHCSDYANRALDCTHKPNISWASHQVHIFKLKTSFDKKSQTSYPTQKTAQDKNVPRPFHHQRQMKNPILATSISFVLSEITIDLAQSTNHDSKFPSSPIKQESKLRICLPFFNSKVVTNPTI